MDKRGYIDRETLVVNLAKIALSYWSLRSSRRVENVVKGVIVARFVNVISAQLT